MISHNYLSEQGGTLEQELMRTAEMLVELARDKGVYFATALLYDSNYDARRMKALLPILQKTRGALHPGWKKKSVGGA